MAQSADPVIAARTAQILSLGQSPFFVNSSKISLNLSKKNSCQLRTDLKINRKLFYKTCLCNCENQSRKFWKEIKIKTIQVNLQKFQSKNGWPNNGLAQSPHYPHREIIIRTMPLTRSPFSNGSHDSLQRYKKSNPSYSVKFFGYRQLNPS